MLRIHNSLTRQKQDFVPIRPGPRRHVRVRHDGVRLLPHRSCARDGGVRRDTPLAARLRLHGALRAQHHRHRRQDHQARARERRDHPGADRALHPLHGRGRGGARAWSKPDFEPRATQYVPGHAAHHRRADRTRAWPIRRQRRCLLLGARVSRLRQVVRQVARRSARRRARRDRPSQARSARLRAVEVGQARRAVLGFALGQGPARAGTSSARP